MRTNIHVHVYECTLYNVCTVCKYILRLHVHVHVHVNVIILYIHVHIILRCELLNKLVR